MILTPVAGIKRNVQTPPILRGGLVYSVSITVFSPRPDDDLPVAVTGNENCDAVNAVAFTDYKPVLKLACISWVGKRGFSGEVR